MERESFENVNRYDLVFISNDLEDPSEILQLVQLKFKKKKVGKKSKRKTADPGERETLKDVGRSEHKSTGNAVPVSKVSAPDTKGVILEYFNGKTYCPECLNEEKKSWELRQIGSKKEAHLKSERVNQTKKVSFNLENTENKISSFEEEKNGTELLQLKEVLSQNIDGSTERKYKTRYFTRRPEYNPLSYQRKLKPNETILASNFHTNFKTGLLSTEAKSGENCKFNNKDMPPAAFLNDDTHFPALQPRNKQLHKNSNIDLTETSPVFSNVDLNYNEREASVSPHSADVSQAFPTEHFENNAVGFLADVSTTGEKEQAQLHSGIEDAQLLSARGIELWSSEGERLDTSNII